MAIPRMLIRVRAIMLAILHKICGFALQHAQTFPIMKYLPVV